MKWLILLKALAKIISIILKIISGVSFVVKNVFNIIFSGIRYIVTAVIRLFTFVIFLIKKIMQSILYCIHYVFKEIIEIRKLVSKFFTKDKSKKVKKESHKKHGIVFKVLLEILWLFLKVIWITRNVIGSLYRRVYWWIYEKIHKLYSKILSLKWKILSLKSKVFGAQWKIRNAIGSLYRKFYWWKYKKKIKIYQEISKNDFLDILLILIKENLSKEKSILQFMPVESVEEYYRRHRDKASFMIVENERNREVCIPEVFEKNKERIERFVSEKIYVAQLKNIEVIGASDVVIADNRLLNDAVFHDKEERLDIRYGAIKKIIQNSAVIETGEVAREIEKGINLLGAASFNYYHLIVEILSRLAFVDYYEEFRNYPILVDEVVIRVPQFATALGYFNKYKHEIITIEKEKRCAVQDMILPSHTVWMPINLYNRDDIRVSDFLISETVLKNIRSLVNLYQEKKPWRKVFISRKNTKAMRMTNEESIRKIFEKNGFEIIYTEEMTFEQQVECFGQAKCIIASSGAALTNTIFCQPGAIIGCIIPSYHKFYMYSTIAHYLDLRPFFLDADIVELTPYAASDTFILNEEYAKRYIKSILNLL